MGNRVAAIAFATLGLAIASLPAAGCGGQRDDVVAKKGSPLIAGTVVDDAASVGVVWLEYLDQANFVCYVGTGVVLTNDTILTAGHVADWLLAKSMCAKGGYVPTKLRVTMPDPSVAGGEQVRVISCGGTTKEGCGARFHSGYQTSTKGNNRGQDAAVLTVSGSLVVNGVSSFYRRPISKDSIPPYNQKVTCYGMSDSAPVAPFTTGVLHKADFTVLKYPHDIVKANIDPSVLPLWETDTMFTISRGGGVTPTGNVYDPGGGFAAITVRGDSGGPCIQHTAGVAGDLMGIDHAAPEVAGADTPKYADITAVQGFRNWLRSALGVQAGRVFADLDLDGSADDGVEVRASSLDTIEVVVFYNNGATEISLDTGISTSLAPFAGSYLGDFDADGDSDVVATIGSALSALPFYFNGAGASSFSFTTPSTWQPNGPYAFMEVGRYDEDGTDDLAAVRADGTEDVFIGEPGVGLTVPAQFVPRGFNWWGAGDQEAFAAGEPGFFIVKPVPGGAGGAAGSGGAGGAAGSSGTGAGGAAGAGGASGAGGTAGAGDPGNSFDSVEGRVFLHSNPGTELEAWELSLSSLQTKLPSLPYSSAPGDGFGQALAWGSFDGDPQRQALVVGAPGVTVDGHTNAGLITVFSRSDTAAAGFAVEELDRKVLKGTATTDAFFGRVLAAGDFDGDFVDDLAVVAADGVLILRGQSGTGLTASSPQTELSLADVGLVTPVAAATSGDVNCDGFEDLVLGAPDENVGGVPGAGAVIVLFGSAGGLDGELRQRVDESVDDIQTEPKPAEFFGQSLAAGNFNGDSFAGRPCVDVAVGVGEGTGSISNGAVHILYGGADGLTGIGSQHLVQGGAAAGGTKIADVSEEGDAFGGFLAVTRADVDRFDDLVIGAWNENSAQGAAHILRGSAAGVTAQGQAFWRQGQGGVPGTPSPPGQNPLSPGNRFGWSVGGTSNGLVVIGASWQTVQQTDPAATLENAGWLATLRVDDASPIGVSDSVVFEGARKDAFYGAVLTGPRPAFVPRKSPPPRYSGSLILQGGVPHDVSDMACARDRVAPVLSNIAVVPACLWPPNHKLVSYELGSDIQFGVSDNCDPSPQVKIFSVVSSEPGGKASFTLGLNGMCLRSERNGPGDRRYTVTLEATDASGNTTQQTATITVPHNKTAGCGVPPHGFVKDGDPSCMF